MAGAMLSSNCLMLEAPRRAEVLARSKTAGFNSIEDLTEHVGSAPLVWHEGLADLARQWAEEMIETGYRHSPDSFRVLPNLHGIGENILMGYMDAGEAHVGWMLSDGHRQNILTPEYTTIGIGIVCRDDGRIWATQMFGIPLDVYPTADTSVPLAEPIVRRDPGPSC